MLSIITWNGGEPVGFFLQSLTSPWFVSSWPLQTYFSPPSTFWPCLYSCLSLCPWLDTRLKPRGGKPGCCPPCPADICISYILDSFSWDPLLGVCPGITYISRISSQVSIGRKKCNCLVFHSKKLIKSKKIQVFPSSGIFPPSSWCRLIGGHNTTSQAMHCQLQRHLVSKMVHFLETTKSFVLFFTFHNISISKREVRGNLFTIHFFTQISK